MSNLAQLEKSFTSQLNLDHPPVAISFHAEPPAGVSRFMGEVPSGCSFWRLAASRPAGQSAFYTVPSNHYNCPIGAYTHQIALPKEREHELMDVLKLMGEIGYVKMEEVPGIPRWQTAPGAVCYARLSDAPGTPDVVIFSVKPGAAMLLNEASRAAGVSGGIEALPRPTCMAVPASAGKGTVLSLGCIGNRIYTEIDEGHFYAMVRGSDLAKVSESLGTIKNANEQLVAYHNQRKPALTKNA